MYFESENAEQLAMTHMEFSQSDTRQESNDPYLWRSPVS